MTPRIIRFANYLRKLLPSSDVGIMELVAKTMSHVALVSGSKAPEYVEFEVKRAFEWLQKADVSIPNKNETKIMNFHYILGKTPCSCIGTKRTCHQNAHIFLPTGITIF